MRLLDHLRALLQPPPRLPDEADVVWTYVDQLRAERDRYLRALLAIQKTPKHAWWLAEQALDGNPTKEEK